MRRLHTKLPKICSLLDKATDRQKRAAALAACEFAVHATEVTCASVSHALAALRGSKPIPPGIVIDLRALEHSLDEACFELQDAGTEKQQESSGLAKFSRARAVSAVLSACVSDVDEATFESIYEASASVDDQDGLVKQVKAALGIPMS